jgi:RNA-binding protein
VLVTAAVSGSALAFGPSPRQPATMPEPTSPKKQSLMPSSPLRKRLRASAHALKPIVQIGKGGLGERVIAQIQRALFDHELVKIKVSEDCPMDRFEVAEALAGLGIGIVQIVGRNITAWVPAPPERRKTAR